MRTLILILIVVFVILAAALGVFIATFDIDQWRPLIITQIEKTLGASVRLEKINLSFQNGIGAELQNLEIYADQQSLGDPDLEIESIQTNIKLLPLLQRSIQVGSLEINKPRISISRNNAGEISVRGIRIAENASSGSAAVPLSFLINQIEIKGADIRFADSSQSNPLNIHIQDFDLKLRNVSLTRWIDFQASAGIFNSEQNISLSGKIKLSLVDHKVQIEGLRLESDLSRFDFDEIDRSMPQMGISSIVQEPSGNLVLKADRILLQDSKVFDYNGAITLQRAGFLLPNNQLQISDARAEISLSKDRIQITRVDADITAVRHMKSQAVSQAIQLKGTVDYWLQDFPKSQFQVKVTGVDLGAITLPQSPRDPYLQGILDGELEASAIGKTWPDISKSLSGQGNFKIADPVLINLNILQQTFEKMSMIPGFIDRLRSRLPETYWEKLKAKDTPLGPLNQAFTITQGVVELQQFSALTEDIQLTGDFQVSLTGAVSARTMLAVDSVLSAALVKSVEELQYLLDDQKRLMIPVVIQGAAPKIQAMPDIQYLASKLAVAKTQEIISGFLQKRNPPTEAQTADTLSNAPGQSAQPMDTTTASGTSNPYESPSQPASGSYQKPPKITAGGLLSSFLQAALENPNDGASNADASTSRT